MFSLHRLWANNLFLWCCLLYWPKLIGKTNSEKFSFFFCSRIYFIFRSHRRRRRFWFQFWSFLILKILIYVLYALSTAFSAIKLFVCIEIIFGNGKLRFLFCRNISVIVDVSLANKYLEIKMDVFYRYQNECCNNNRFQSKRDLIDSTMFSTKMWIRLNIRVCMNILFTWKVWKPWLDWADFV